jgi:tetratricopeptide (TPR) repeat protein
MLVEINKKNYKVDNNEFIVVPHSEYNNLIIREKVGYYERVSSLLDNLRFGDDSINLLIQSPTHGGFLPIECSQHFSHVYLLDQDTDQQQKSNTNENIASHNISNISWIDEPEQIQIQGQNYIYFCEKNYMNLIENDDDAPMLVAPLNETIVSSKKYSKIYNLSDTELFVYIPSHHSVQFQMNFHYFIQNDLLKYDNLIHLCIMVKNGGAQFEEMLTKNLPIIDCWTILDTGSTDDTLDIINRVLVGKKKGQLYCESFINFRDTRNRCLDLAGKTCKYTLMLDDTYIIEDDLRGFLNVVRGDQFGDSHSLYIKSNDSEYVSNRIVKTDRNLRYIYKIHEVISNANNKNVIVPMNKSRILDYRCDYMETRTMNRKQYDIQLLLEELDEDPNDPRHLYYLGQTYNVLGNFEKAYEYFIKRVEHPNEGFLQEKIDACFEAARNANFKLNKPWTICEELYLKSYEMDKTRPDSLYFLGIHYNEAKNYEKAFFYFKEAFRVGYPIHAQYSLKPTLSFHFLPKFLPLLCYMFEDFSLGLSATTLFLQNNKADADQYIVMVSWHKIFENLVKMPPLVMRQASIVTKPYLCFVADGGFEPWTGSDILTKGVGGSETYIIEMARHIQKQGTFQVVVFCNCLKDTFFEDVIYYQLNKYFSFVRENPVHSCIVSRFSEYLPVAFKSCVENVYLVLHDLTPSGCVIPIDPKLKKIFCLTEWHVEYMSGQFPQLNHLLTPFYYGIDVDKFGVSLTHTPIEQFKFIYSSFPNRGLLQLLKMWRRIYSAEPRASLHIYSDVNGKWVNSVAGEEMAEIRKLLKMYNEKPNKMNVYYHGWVSKKELADAWLTSDIWFYPCTFAETFCLTALEAALTKTFAITSNLAALNNTVGDRGILIPGDATTEEWQNAALTTVLTYMTSSFSQKKKELVEPNYQWAKQLSWKNQATRLLNEYLLKNLDALECNGMYNWTHDLPEGTGAKQIFENMILHFNKTHCNVESEIKVLEIGVYTGTSLIEIVKMIPCSRGVAIDSWTNYKEQQHATMNNMVESGVECAFYRNVEKARLSSRISARKGDSYEILLEMNRMGEKYDFIYVDGSHLCLDVYLDLMLSWKLLNVGGIMAIDDYMFLVGDEFEILKRPFEAVNYFLEKCQDEITVLNKGYRLFIEKREKR